MMRKIVTCLLSIAMLILLSLTLLSQDAPVVISSQNITQLESVARIDFESLPESAGSFITGRFALSGDGQYLAVVNDENGVVLLNLDGEVLGTYLVEGSDVVDMTFDLSGERLISLHDSGGAMTVVSKTVDFSESQTYQFDVDGFPQSIWSDEDNRIWVEIVSDAIEVAQLILESETFELIPYAPALDESAVVRIGRIPPPYVVTSSQEGEVKFWDLQTGEVISDAQVEEGPAVFGQINGEATHLAWRDQLSESLYLLNIETGENQFVAPLDGEYVQYFFLTPDADVIIAAHLEDRPEIVAWDVASGERYLLGEHRTCNRVPDMIRMSRDGTTLVVGCDTGLDIWGIVE